jgi:hypothetical protein
MATYEDLFIDHFYLVREHADEDIVLIQPAMETNLCVLIMHYDDYETTYWRKKEDPIFEIVEELNDEQVEEYENLFEDEDEEDWEEEDEEE